MVRPALIHGVLALAVSTSSMWGASANAAPTPRSASKGLSMDEAARRASSVDNVTYDLAFVLSDKDADKDFSGTSIIRFDVRDATSHLTLDFQGGVVKELLVNGKRQSKVTFNKNFIELPALKPGANEITVSFKHPYSTSGAGLYRFKDPEDASPMSIQTSSRMKQACYSQALTSRI